jgi:hypothetical protein
MRTRITIHKNDSFASQAEAASPRLKNLRANKESIGNVLSLKRPTVKSNQISLEFCSTLAILQNAFPAERRSSPAAGAPIGQFSAAGFTSSVHAVLGLAEKWHRA